MIFCYLRCKILSKPNFNVFDKEEEIYHFIIFFVNYESQFSWCDYWIVCNNGSKS